MEMKSDFNLAFAFDERSLQRISVKNAQTFQSLPLCPIVYPKYLFSVKIVTNKLNVRSLCQRKSVSKRLFDYF